eukprot:GHRQ01025983.1.p1 GENE.GHRQ01025983.1~~GHRQ01025983.1.p1  ORF type:complete len:103 (+),score=6.80 GHRQ01025983.1:458-766(+)
MVCCQLLVTLCASKVAVAASITNSQANSSELMLQLTKVSKHMHMWYRFSTALAVLSTHMYCSFRVHGSWSMLQSSCGVGQLLTQIVLAYKRLLTFSRSSAFK